MPEFGSRISCRAKVLCAVAIVAGALLAPTTSYAQANQPIVMVCKWDGNPAFQHVITLDMARKSVVIEQIVYCAPNCSPSPQRSVFPQGTVTQVTDQQIMFIVPANINDPSQTLTGSLNRYTGALSEESSTPSPQGIKTSEYACQKQQKQF
ncbi:MAG TPA: hypothetical protein VMV19_21160 [Xanthobacteraceae bacterium]|nr:hypothetical protein [Xanthobacteraceae bacterium]